MLSNKLLKCIPKHQASPARLINQLVIETSSSGSSPATRNKQDVKPYDKIPASASFLPASLELLLAGGAGYLHEHCDRRHKQLGPIYRDYLGPIEIVFLGSSSLIQQVVANEGQYPRHNVPEAWSYYNDVHQIERGLFFQMGEPWARLRRVISKVMLADSRSSTRFVPDLLAINDDLLSSWHTRFATAGSKVIVVPDVKAALCNWSIESTGSMLFGCRMGCVPVSGDVVSDDPRANELVEHVSNMFAETANFQLVPVRLAHRLNLGTWKRFEMATSGMLRLANSYAAENLARVLEDLPNSRSLLADMLKLETLSRDEITRSLVDLIIAAADTTSAALQWMIYLLAKHPDLQSRILAEIRNEASGTTDTEMELKAPLLRAFIRESLRLYPTAPFLARTLDRDIVLNGYHIPAGKLLVFSLYTTSRMAEYFEEPLDFKPERWLRGSSDWRKQQQHEGCPHRTRSRSAYASLPFGIGARMCVGRRAAELQMLTFLGSFIEKYQSSLTEGQDETKVRLKMILAPTKPISITLTPR